MDQRLSFVTLAAGDLDASRDFYVDGLGWTAELFLPRGDPDGCRWEVACNPGPVGALVLP